MGLAIKDALGAVVPLFLNGQFRGMLDNADEAIRLAVFLLVSVRFFLGAVVYFDEAYFSGTKCEGDYGKWSSSLGESYRRDFLFGFFHFILFFAWSHSIVQGPEVAALAYPAILVLILGYDLAWWRFAPLSGRHEVKVWAVVNAANLVIAVLVFLLIDYLAPPGVSAIYAEPAALSTVAVVSLVDVAGLIRGESLFRRMFGALAKKDAHELVGG